MPATPIPQSEIRNPRDSVGLRPLLLAVAADGGKFGGRKQGHIGPDLLIALQPGGNAIRLGQFLKSADKDPEGVRPLLGGQKKRRPGPWPSSPALPARPFSCREMIRPAG